MNTKRWKHACFQDEETSSIYTAGGVDDQFNSLSSTETWTFEENSWQYSANLPGEISWSSAVSSNTDKFIGYIAGGFTRRGASKKIYGLRRDQAWIEMNKTMKIERYGHSLLNIPVNQVLGC